MVLYNLALPVHSTIVSLKKSCYLCNILRLATLRWSILPCTLCAFIDSILIQCLYYFCNILRLATLSWFYTILHSLCILPYFLYTVSYTNCSITYNLLHFHGFILPCTLCAFYHSFFIQCLILFVQ